mmetsp:Transcript_8297/g.18539  ORF Transcript_8297/g.18539 Transcript_8297/m.18539 type:complete len:392 (+) Transcript_8297:62-1237(+)
MGFQNAADSTNGFQVGHVTANDLSTHEAALNELSERVSVLENESTAASSSASQAQPLCIMTLNLQYFASYPEDTEAATRRLAQVTGGDAPPDCICVQEGIAGKDVLGPVGFDLVVCAGELGVAQSVYDMVYGHEPTLQACDSSLHSRLLCNQIYLRQGSEWGVHGSGVLQTSSNSELQGGGGRATGVLAVRSMVWVKLRRKGSAGTGPSVYVMCTHITGGRFEDQYFVQQLAQERYNQPDSIISFFNERSQSDENDVGILLGDFNATTEYIPDGPMQRYFKAQISSSLGVQSDAEAAALSAPELEERFKQYMISPFKCIRDTHGWQFAYTQAQVGVTSGFAHLIDHMAMSRPLKVVSAEVMFLTNQKFSDVKDTNLPLTDHNSVKVVFLVE